MAKIKRKEEKKIQKTKIEWVKNPDGTQGYTCSNKTGCLNHINGLCKGGNFPCYAYKLAHGRLRRRYLANTNVGILSLKGLLHGKADDPFYPRFWSERLEQIRKHKKPVGIFLDDMSDWMGDYWPKEWTEQEIQVMRDCPQHRFYTLTKQPQNLLEWKFPENCWVGVTVCNDRMLDIAVDKLEDIQAKIKFISFEPLLERLTLSLDYAFYYSGTDWLIIGAQTKPYKLPKIEWVQEIVEAADRVGIPIFLKDNLRSILPLDRPFYKPILGGRDEGNWVLRQELSK